MLKLYRSISSRSTHASSVEAERVNESLHRPKPLLSLVRALSCVRVHRSLTAHMGTNPYEQLSGTNWGGRQLMLKL